MMRILIEFLIYVKQVAKNLSQLKRCLLKDATYSCESELKLRKFYFTSPLEIYKNLKEDFLQLLLFLYNKGLKKFFFEF